MTPLPHAARADRLASLLQDGVTAALAQRLLEAEALRPRLGALLVRRLGPPPSVSGLPRLLAMSAAELDLLRLHAGSVWHAAELLRLLDGGAVRSLVVALGFDPRPLAARHAKLPPIPGASASPLQDRIAADGQVCLAAWCAALPPPADRYAALCLPPAAASDAAHSAHGPRIVTALLSEAA